MSDATDAVLDIQEALDEYGSDITLKIATKAPYDPILGNVIASMTSHNLKAIPGNYNQKEIQDPNVHIKDKKFRFYYTGEIGYDDKIVFRGGTYSLERIDTKIFQNEMLLYTVQGRI